MTLVLKDPLAALDYAVDWGADYLGGASVAESGWAVDPVESGGIEIAGSRVDSAVATVTATGGIEGRVYRLTNHIALDSGLTDSRSIVVRVEKR